MYEDNSFITLTYDDENLPWDHSLNKQHFQKFMKKLRKKYEGTNIRYYHCGEYGQATPQNDFIARPHYHAIIFNKDFNDKKIWKTDYGNYLYISDTLDNIWGKGFTTIGDVTFQSAAYCARYIMKKVNGARKEDHYKRTDYTTGEVIDLVPEYTTMSRRPGVGHGWLEKYKEDVFRDDFIVSTGGLIINPPKYYDSIYESENPLGLEKIKQIRKEKLSKHKRDLTPERLKTREICKLAQIKQLSRTL